MPVSVVGDFDFTHYVPVPKVEQTHCIYSARLCLIGVRIEGSNRWLLHLGGKQQRFPIPHKLIRCSFG